MPPEQKVDTNAVTRASFRRDAIKNKYASALLYKLQRKKRLESTNQSNMDNTSTDDTSTNLQLLVIWGPDNMQDIPVRSLIIKHSNIIIWNEGMLEKLHSIYLALLKKSYHTEDTWLLDDATVLMTTTEWKYVGFVTEITISKGIKEDDSMEPLYVPPSMCVTDDGV
jgi:hypothetical protein